MPTILVTGTSIPDFVVTNDYIISLVIENSRRFYKGESGQLEAAVSGFLAVAGAKRRRWRSGFTKPLEHISDAWINCFSKAGRDSLTQIGAIIYCGIDKGVVEPSHASLLAQKFGLSDVRALDVSDACMAWFTATQIASRIVNESRPLCVVISAEFPVEVPGKVYPESFKIRNDDDLLWKGAALTLGECAAVTLIRSFGNKPECSVFRSNNNYADICCVPLERPDRFIDSAELLARLSANCFIANMGKMASVGYRDAQRILKDYVAAYGKPEIVLPHTVSQTMPHHISKGIIENGSLKNCFEEFGNIATCSIPVGYEYFDCASSRGAHIAGWIAAAGMSHSVFRINNDDSN